MIRFLFIWMLLLGTLMTSFAEAATPFYEQYAERISDYLQTLRKMNI